MRRRVNEAAARKTTPLELVKPSPIKLDIGCGTRKKEGFVGMDRRQFPGVDVVHDINAYPWPLADSSVEEVSCTHVLEHLEHNARNPERVRFMNELHRVLVPSGRATIVTPHWASCRAYGDFTHADKPVSEMFWYYLSRQWRKTEAPDNDAEWNPDGYTCDFQATWGYTMKPDLLLREEKHQRYALENFKEAALDMIATLVALK
jgi:predicted SAM-dependent methyltransferase